MLGRNLPSHFTVVCRLISWRWEQWEYRFLKRANAQLKIPLHVCWKSTNNNFLSIFQTCGRNSTSKFPKNVNGKRWVWWIINDDKWRKTRTRVTSNDWRVHQINCDVCVVWCDNRSANPTIKWTKISSTLLSIFGGQPTTLRNKWQNYVHKLAAATTYSLYLLSTLQPAFLRYYILSVLSHARTGQLVNVYLCYCG